MGLTHVQWMYVNFIEEKTNMLYHLDLVISLRNGSVFQEKYGFKNALPVIL